MRGQLSQEPLESEPLGSRNTHSWMKWHIQLFPDRNRDCKQAIKAIAHALHEVKKIIDVAHRDEPFTLGRADLITGLANLNLLRFG